MSMRELNPDQETSLVDVLDCVLDKGVAIKGDIVISVAGIDLVYLDLRILLTSVETLIQSREEDYHEQSHTTAGSR
ncbi:gas vesicle protein [Alkalicoccus urumqiensis]|uniref:Gas vesicle protein n=1 Tax=Alkalicoccus urumqiensis TaxID=1548213 RepID=A0A2P6MIS5_ALKUR|nr:gas vesicle protein [Alkalicoccus urumqiensis]PRO66181.1 gas vesicle protein [Alkalicoccus urumqiensis]